MTASRKRGAVYLVLMLGIYLAYYAYAGYQTHADSDQYIVMHIRRDPLYPLWLAALRVIFRGSEAYLFAAGLLQCIINALVNVHFAMRIVRLLQGGVLMEIWALALVFFPQFITRMLSVTRVYLAGDIMSESFSYPLFLLILLSLTAVVTGEGKSVLREKDTWLSFAEIFAMSMLRGQLLALIIVWIIAVCFRIVRDLHADKKKMLTQAAIAVLALILFFPVRTVLLKSYTYAVRGRYETHPNIDNLALSHVLFVSDREDAEAVPDERAFDTAPEYTLREYFLMMYDKMESLGMNHRYAEGSVYEYISFMELCNDPLKFTVTEDVVFQTLSPLGYAYETMDFMENHVSGEIRKALLPAVFPRWLFAYVCLVFRGLIRSIGVMHPQLWVVFFAIELGALFLCVYAWIKRRATAQANAMALVLLTMAGMATSISLVHICLERYMFYLFPVFYVVIAQLVMALYREKRV